MIALTSKVTEEKADMVDLFSIDDKVYQVPAKPRVNVALKYLTNVKELGNAVAEMQLLEDLLGEEGYRALSEFDGLTAADLSAVSEAAARLVLGALEDAGEGNGESGSGKSAG